MVSFIVGVDVDVGVGTVRAVVLGVLDVAIGIRSFDFVGVFIEFCVVDGSAELFDKATDKTKNNQYLYFISLDCLFSIDIA